MRVDVAPAYPYLTNASMVAFSTAARVVARRSALVRRPGRVSDAPVAECRSARSIRPEYRSLTDVLRSHLSYGKGLPHEKHAVCIGSQHGQAQARRRSVPGGEYDPGGER